MNNTRPAVLVIAGADSSGGAGLIRDVQVLTDLGVDALCAVTAVTAQSNTQIAAVHHVPPELIRAQIIAAFATRAIGAVKIGMLGRRASIEAVLESLPARTSAPIVLDPVLASTSGTILLDADGHEAMRQGLFPRVALLTPNAPEAAMLLAADLAVDEPALTEQARRLLALGPQAVLIKGGHTHGVEAVDLLVTGPQAVERLVATRLRATSRGTGCALASAVACGLARGLPVAVACRNAKDYVRSMLTRNLPASFTTQT